MQTPKWFIENTQQEFISAYGQIHNKRYHYLHWQNHNKPRIIFIHGALANAYWYAFIAPFFTDNFDIISISLPGHGKSDWQESYHADDFLNIIAKHSKTDTQNILIGHSLGAKLCLHYLQEQHVNISHTILLDPPIGTPFFHNKKRPTQHHQIYPDADILAQRFRIIPRQPMDNSYICAYVAKNSICAESNGYRWQFDPNFFNKLHIGKYTDYAATANLKTQMHLIYGVHSSITTENVRNCIQKHYPDISIHPLDHAWHALMLDQPLALTKLIQDILTTAKT